MEGPHFVLIIEDAEDIAAIYAEILEMHHMSSEIVTDGALALERLSTIVPDLILLDLHLPHVSGLDILTFVRADLRLKDTKVIVITANAQLAADLDDVADLTLLKPVCYAEISALSARMLQQQPV